MKQQEQPSRVVSASYSLYPEEREIVEQVNKQQGFRNESAALRYIIRNWAATQQATRR